jgi:hypothetical protein
MVFCITKHEICLTFADLYGIFSVVIVVFDMLSLLRKLFNFQSTPKAAIPQMHPFVAMFANGKAEEVANLFRANPQYYTALAESKIDQIEPHLKSFWATMVRECTFKDKVMAIKPAMEAFFAHGTFRFEGVEIKSSLLSERHGQNLIKATQEVFAAKRLKSVAYITFWLTNGHMSPNIMCTDFISLMKEVRENGLIATDPIWLKNSQLITNLENALYSLDSEYAKYSHSIINTNRIYDPNCTPRFLEWQQEVLTHSNKDFDTIVSEFIEWLEVHFY